LRGEIVEVLGLYPITQILCDILKVRSVFHITVYQIIKQNFKIVLLTHLIFGKNKMKDIEIKDIMIDLSDYATVSENESIITAIKVLKTAQQDTKFKYKHRAVLVYGTNGQISGKLSMFDILKALEPKYKHFEHSDPAHGHIGLSRFGLSQQFLDSLVDSHDLWNDTLDELMKRITHVPVAEVMYSPTKGEYIEIESPISEAIHKFILGGHQSLLVSKDDNVVGVLRLSDVFNLIYEKVKLK
jgi:predicted transcriptional regulator